MQNKKREPSPPTPLERKVGFKVAESTYDELTLPEQVIIDLLIQGWTHRQIGELFGVSQPSISSRVRRIRFKLAESELRLTLDIRKAFKEGRG